MASSASPAPQTVFSVLAATPVQEWLPVAECRRRLSLSHAAVEQAIAGGLAVRGRGGLLKPNGQRTQRVRLVELAAVRAACGP